MYCSIYYYDDLFIIISLLPRYLDPSSINRFINNYFALSKPYYIFYANGPVHFIYLETLASKLVKFYLF